MIPAKTRHVPLSLSKYETRIIVISFLFLVGLALLRSAQNYLKYAATVDYFSIPLTLLFNFIVFSSFVLFTPIIIRLTQRFPLAKHQLGNIGIHIGLSLGLVLLQMLLCNLILYVIDLSSSPIFPVFIKKYLTGFIQFHLLAYWIILLFISHKQRRETQPKYLERFVIKDGHFTTTVARDQVHWIEALDHYQKLHTDTGFFLYKDTMANLVKQLPDDQFMRIHRSAIVNTQHIKGLRRADQQLLVKLENGEEVAVGKSYRSKVQALF